MVLNQDWNQRYVDADTPWDSGVPSEHLKTLVAEGVVSPGRALEIGCGTGTNAIFLARAGFEVTAIDLAEAALSKAKMKAEQAGVKVNFIQADATDLPRLGEPFPFVFDRGTYHIVRSINLSGYQLMLSRMVAPAGYFYVLAGNANEDGSSEKGPPRIRAHELCAEIEAADLDLVRLNESKFHLVRIANEDFEPLAWCALFRRRQCKRSS